MASPRYTLNIDPSELEEPQHIELTPKEKRANWFHYHKIMLIAILVAAFLVGWFVYDMVTKVDPDYTIAIISPSTIPDTTITSLEEGLTPYAIDRDGDGHVVVEVIQYTYSYISEIRESLDAYTTMAAEMQITNDLTNNVSIIFITDCFEALEDNVEIFVRNDDPYGYPEESQRSDYDAMSFAWNDSSVLSTLPLEGSVTQYTTGETIPAQDFFSNFRISMRTLYDSEDKALSSYFGDSLDLYTLLRTGSNSATD